MAQKSKGMRRKTRKKLTKSRQKTGAIAKHLQSFEDGEQVLIRIDPAQQSGMPHPRFHGRTAEIMGTRGRSYVIRVADGGTHKQFAVHPAHLEAQ